MDPLDSEVFLRPKVNTYGDISVQLNEVKTKLDSGVEVDDEFYDEIQRNIDILFEHLIGYFRRDTSNDNECYESSKTMTNKLFELIRSLSRKNSEAQMKLKEFAENLEKLNRRDTNARLMEASRSTLFFGQLITEVNKRVVKRVLGEQHDDIVTIEQMEKAIEQERPYKSALSDDERQSAKPNWAFQKARLKLNDKLIRFMMKEKGHRNTTAHPTINEAGYEQAISSMPDSPRKLLYKQLWNIHQQLQK